MMTVFLELLLQAIYFSVRIMYILIFEKWIIKGIYNNLFGQFKKKSSCSTHFIWSVHRRDASLAIFEKWMRLHQQSRNIDGTILTKAYCVNCQAQNIKTLLMRVSTFWTIMQCDCIVRCIQLFFSFQIQTMHVVLTFPNKNAFWWVRLVLCYFTHMLNKSRRVATKPYGQRRKTWVYFLYNFAYHYCGCSYAMQWSCCWQLLFVRFYAFFVISFGSLGNTSYSQLLQQIKWEYNLKIWNIV